MAQGVFNVLTYEEVTGYFLKAADATGLTVHPEYWMNTRSLEREFACTCHIGSCDEAEEHSSCSISFTWGSLDTALSLDGPAGVCEFFHGPDPSCPHLQTSAIPPLVLDLSYTLPLHGTAISEETLLSLLQLLRLRASEHSRRTTETRPGVSVVLQDNRLVPDVLTLQQRVEIPIWHPDGMRGLLDDSPELDGYENSSYPDEREEVEEGGVEVATPHPELWLPQVMQDVCQDIICVLQAMDAALSLPPHPLF